MQKAELDRLLEKTVADALGVRLQHRRTPPPKAKVQAKVVPKRARAGSQELHPA